MKTLMLLIITVSTLCACSVGTVERPEAVASLGQALCVGPAGLQATGLVAAPTAVQRAHFLVNKMWGAWPKPPAVCPGAWYCGTLVPNTCGAAQCAAGQCFGWTCQQTALNYADDGLRLSTVVAGTSLIDNQFALQPNANGLTALEVTELTATRAAGALVTDYWCGQ